MDAPPIQHLMQKGDWHCCNVCSLSRILAWSCLFKCQANSKKLWGTERHFYWPHVDQSWNPSGKRHSLWKFPQALWACGSSQLEQFWGGGHSGKGCRVNSHGLPVHTSGQGRPTSQPPGHPVQLSCNHRETTDRLRGESVWTSTYPSRITENVNEPLLRWQEIQTWNKAGCYKEKQRIRSNIGFSRAEKFKESE